MARRISAVDIGSNTIHHIIVDEQKAGQIAIIERQVELLRFGADIAAMGAVSEKKLAEATQVLQYMAARAQTMGAIHHIGVATEGVRAAKNASEILTRLSTAYGNTIILIDGLEEAVLSYWGATSDQDLAGSIAIADLGGGSCEFVVGQHNQLTWAQSLPLGSGRLIDAIQPTDPPSLADIAALTTLAYQIVTAVVDAPPLPDILIGVGGTANAIARILHPGDPSAIITREDIHALLLRIQTTSLDTLANMTEIDQERLRLVIGGAVAWDTILQWAQLTQFRASERGVREGAALAWLQAGERWRDLVHTALANLSS